MTRGSLMALALLTFVCTPPGASTEYEDKPPVAGPWRGCEPGTWILQKWVFHNHPVLEDRVEYRRIMLLGWVPGPPAGYAALASVKSTSPDGPWTPAGGGTDLDWREYNKGFITQLPDETLTFEKGTALCEVFQVDKTDDWGRTVNTLWFDKGSGLLLQSEISFDGVDDDGNPRNSSRRMETVRLETRVLKGRNFEVAVQREPYRVLSEKVSAGIQETVKCAEIPGEILSLASWATRDTSLPPITFKELLDWGVDREARGKYIEEHPPYEVVRQQREEERRIQIEREEEKNRERVLEEQRRFWDWAITEATSADEETRSYAFKQMPWRGYRGVPEGRKEEVLRLAREAVDDESLPVRREAVLVLAWLEEPASLELLSRMLEEDPDGAYRYVEALARTGDPAAGEPLARALEHEDARVRLAAARYLLRFDEERARSALEDIASGTGDASIRAEALEMLAKKDDSRLRSALLATLTSEDETLRSSACFDLLETGLGLDPELTAAVLNVLDDDSWHVRLSAIMVLGEHKVEEAAPKLIELLHQDETYQTKDEFFGIPMAYFAADSLGSIGTPEGVDTLFELLDEPDCRYFGVYGLLVCPDPRAAEFLWTLYRTGKYKVEELPDISRSGLLKRIAESGDENLLREIRSYLESEALPPERAALRETVQDLESRLGQGGEPREN